MAASSVEAMHSIDNLFDQIAVGSYRRSVWCSWNVLIRRWRTSTLCPVWTIRGRSGMNRQRMRIFRLALNSSCHMLPQQPLHPSMFPSSSKRKTAHCLTNPYDFQIGDIRYEGLLLFREYSLWDSIRLVYWVRQDRISMISICNPTLTSVCWSWRTVWNGAPLHRHVPIR